MGDVVDKVYKALYEVFAVFRCYEGKIPHGEDD